MTKEIDIKWNDKVHTVLVDDDSYSLLARHTWYIMYSGEAKKPYAFAELYSMKNGVKIKRMFYMHQMVTGSWAETDHINGNTLDNQHHNLRPATKQENNWNKPKQKSMGGKPCGSRYKGVRFAPLRGKPRWQALFRHVERGAHKSTGKTIFIGYYDTEDQAALAYNAEIVKYRGEFAWLNQVNSTKDIGQ